jgi:serine/threonine protein kinase
LLYFFINFMKRMLIRGSEVGNFKESPLGYTKAADLYSLGVLAASLLTGDLMIPREELAILSQVEIADRLIGIEDDWARRQWKDMPPRALNFVRKLLKIDSEQRMTAAEAVEHSWFTRPASEAAALAEGIKRINRFWKRRDISSEEVLEVSNFVP